MTAPPRFNAGPETRGITITVNERVYAGLVDMARAASRTPNVQAQLLFEAAYSARCKPTGDRDLDAAVAAIDTQGGGIVPPALVPSVLAFLKEGEGAPAGVTLPEVVMPQEKKVFATNIPSEPKVLTARQAQHAAIVARAKAAVPSKLDRPPAVLPPPPVTEPENDHVDVAPAAPQATAMEAAPQDAPGAMGVAEGEAVEPVPAAAEPAGAPVETLSEPVGLAAPAVVGAGEPADTPPAPAAAPAEPVISAATLKYMRTLKAIGNSMDEIADMVDLPVKAVREALAGKQR